MLRSSRLLAADAEQPQDEDEAQRHAEQPQKNQNHDALLSRLQIKTLFGCGHTGERAI
jgi:hypothetical protein